MKYNKVLIFLMAIILFLFPLGAYAENIDPDNDGSRYAYGENVGWINMKPSQGPGITVTNSAVTGMAWGENIGWINLYPSNGGVVNDGKGNLSGYAWGENVGWINFNPTGAGVKIDPFTGLFSGMAWGENIGWINFAPNDKPVKTSWRSDTTPPTIVISNCPAKVNLGASASVVVTVTDSGSGVAYQSAPNGTNVLDTSTVGTKTFTVTAKDNAGNVSSNSCTYQVIYDFLGAGGFKAPIKNPPVTNIVKAGSTVPVKWQLPDGKGGFISDLGAVTSIKFEQVACSDFSSALTEAVDTTATGGTVLRYDFTVNQYIYNWKTSQAWAGQCYILILTLNDGMSYQANFSLK